MDIKIESIFDLQYITILYYISLTFMFTAIYKFESKLLVVGGSYGELKFIKFPQFQSTVFFIKIIDDIEVNAEMHRKLRFITEIGNNQFLTCGSEGCNKSDI